MLITEKSKSLRIENNFVVACYIFVTFSSFSVLYLRNKNYLLEV